MAITAISDKKGVEMTINVYTPKEGDHWHWRIIGPMDKPDGEGDAVETIASCCNDGETPCSGFCSQDTAERAGWNFAKANGIR